MACRKMNEDSAYTLKAGVSLTVFFLIALFLGTFTQEMNSACDNSTSFSQSRIHMGELKLKTSKSTVLLFFRHLAASKVYKCSHKLRFYPFLLLLMIKTKEGLYIAVKNKTHI